MLKKPNSLICRFPCATSLYRRAKSTEEHPNAIDYGAESIFEVEGRDYVIDTGAKQEEIEGKSQMCTDNRSFKELGVLSKLCRHLGNHGITDPNPIQQLSLPVTFKTGKAGSCVIQSETGSGKTLAYLLPALQDTRPRLTSLVVTPTRELAVQVCHWAQQLTGAGKISKRISLLVSGRNEKQLLQSFKESNPHILIGTPKILQTVVAGNEEMGRSISRVVLDEGDILLDPLHPRAPWRAKRVRELHPKPIRTILEGLIEVIGSRSVQLICTSATIPTGLQEELMDIGWTGPLPVITTNKSTKQVPPTISHTHLLSEPEHKGAELVRHFKENGFKSALVFIHRDASIKKFAKELNEMGVVTEPLYAHLDTPAKLSDALIKFEKGEIQLMVGNEETVRGLDFPFLDTVYLTELPRNATEYLHSAGRVGRCGREGRVVVMVHTPRDVGRLRRMYDRLGIVNIEGEEEERLLDNED